MLKAALFAPAASAVLLLSAIASGINVDQEFKESSLQLVDYIINGPAKNSGYEWLEPLVDDFGNRHVGSKSLEAAINYTVERLTNDGFDNVHTEEVPNLPHWVRGHDQAIMLEPRRLRLNILAVAGSQPSDVTAPVVVLKELGQLDSVNVSGKIVVFAQDWLGYGPTAQYRRSASLVEKKGGVGVLVKSLGPFSLSTPHTGSGVTDGITIPAACITIEEAELLARLYGRGKKIVIRVVMQSRSVGVVTSRNTIFDIRGSRHPEQIILLSGHMDSWDVGQGALDDGGGMAAVWQAMRCILQLGKDNSHYRPLRTIRGVFWTAEEQGFYGAEAYYKAHKGENESFFFVSETDQGAFKPESLASQLTFMGSEVHLRRIEEIVKLLNSFGIPLSVSLNKSQGDVLFWANDGVPSANYVSEKGIDFYFYFHHTQADYLSVFREGDIDYTAAIFATLAHVLANMDSWE